MLPQFLADQGGKVEVVALTLLPDVVRGVVSRPDDQIQVDLLQLLKEELEGLHGEVAVI